MKRYVLAFVACASLCLASAWLIITPAYAGGASATCSNGSTITCKGISCVSWDAQGGQGGYCSCRKDFNSTETDTKTCN